MIFWIIRLGSRGVGIWQRAFIFPKNNLLNLSLTLAKNELIFTNMNTNSQNSQATSKAQRKEAEKELRSVNIQNAAEEVFAKKGFHGAKMEDIAENSGHAVGALYKYFKSKDQIYWTLINRRLDEMRQLNSDALTGERPILQELEDLIMGLISYFHKNKNFFCIYVNEVKGFQWSLQDNIEASVYERYQNFLRVLERRLALAAQEKELRSDIPPLSMAVAILGVINAFFTQMVSSSENAPENWDGKTIFSILVQGIVGRDI